MPPKQSAQGADREMQPKDKSQAQWFKEQGFKGHYDFNMSYGVKPGDDEGAEEMSSAVKMMREHEQAAWEAEHGKK